MYALVKTGGKQYRVSKDDTILVERLSAEEGEQIILNDIVMLGDGDKVTIGTPLVDGAGVSATVVRQTRGPACLADNRCTDASAINKRCANRNFVTIAKHDNVV